MRKKTIIAVIFAGAVFIVGAVSGFLAAEILGNADVSFLGSPSPSDASLDVALLEDTLQILRDRYIRPEDLVSQELLWGAIRGLVRESTDDYTTFFDPKEAKRFLEDTSGHFEGIGAEIGFRNGLLTIVAPLNKTPAEKAGLLAGDVILAIDDETTENITLEKAVNNIRGPAGSTVTLLISRNREAPQEFSITRAQIVVPPLELSFDDGIAT